MNTGNKKARVIKASRMLQAKIGPGPLDMDMIKECQKIIDDNDVDFGPLAKEQLALLNTGVENALKGEGEHTALIAGIVEPVMQIKANASMFKYDLLGRLANIMLNFLETIENLDKDVLEIVKAHHNTLTLIINSEMKGDGGPAGAQLEKELKDACKRYFAKQADTPSGGSAGFFKD